MSRKPYIFLSLWLFAAQLPAQVLVGPTVGPNLSWISYDDKDLKDTYKVKPMLGFHAGATVSFRVQKRFFLNTSLVYSTKGKIIENKFDPLFRNKVRYHYISMPVLYTMEFKASLGSNRQYKWYFGAGPNISYWLGGKGKLTSSDLEEVNVFGLDYKVVFNKDPEDVEQHEMIVQDPNRIQLGINLAAGFVFEPMGYQKIMLLLRYEMGHSFLSGTTNGMFDPVTYQDEMRVRTHGFRLSISYLVDLKTDQRKKGKSTIKKRRL